ncbi:hypothetical protein M758_6G083400 [Ceratodon purpureus]|nr:hypothetical protein M758_6G083400 [Ceratodon purpureus]
MAKCSDEAGIKEAQWKVLRNLREMLDDLQGSIYFEKKLSATNARYGSTEANQRKYGQLSIPRWFVQVHGDKFRREVILRMGVSRKPWPHRLSFSTSREVPEVTFSGCRWSTFVISNDLVEGDQLVFSLTAMSQFQVYVFDAHGDSKAPQPLRRPVMIQRPLRYYNPEEDTACQNSSHNNTPDSQIEEAFLLKDVPGLPSFSHRLAASDVSRLEIPKDFAATYGSRLDGSVQLQGIHEGSPMQNDVQCVRYTDNRLVSGRTRLFLTVGWDDFVRNNALRIEQELVFTLTADSCFTVREEIYWNPATGALSTLGSQALLSATT